MSKLCCGGTKNQSANRKPVIIANTDGPTPVNCVTIKTARKKEA